MMMAVTQMAVELMILSGLGAINLGWMSPIRKLLKMVTSLHISIYTNGSISLEVPVSFSWGLYNTLKQKQLVSKYDTNHLLHQKEALDNSVY